MAGTATTDGRRVLPLGGFVVLVLVYLAVIQGVGLGPAVGPVGASPDVHRVGTAFRRVASQL
jgi:hypothetical protein